MKIRNKEIDLKHVGKCVFCIGIGTAVGLVVYAIFLYFKIAIFGWNLGLAFAPVAAGYAETVLANRLVGRNLGAVSAFILFIDTTFYSFILKNPTLGMNIITAGSIIVILQAAFPTLINYLILVVLGAILSNFRWVIAKVWKPIKRFITHTFRWETPNEETAPEDHAYFDEKESNEKLNSMNFFFMTSTDMRTKSHNPLGIFQSDVFIENKDTLSVKRDEVENLRLVKIKKGKDEGIIKLADAIKEADGNGVLDLNIQYGVVGKGGNHIHITVTGMGVKLKDRNI